jgi:hypothetical protein
MVDLHPSITVLISDSPAKEFAMKFLNDLEFAVTQRFCQLVSEKIATHELDVIIEHDFREFVRYRKEVSPKHIINPTFHPEYSNLTPQDSFWLRAVDSWGRTVATCAKRVMDTECFHEDLVSLRLWQGQDVPDPAVSFRSIDCQPAQWLSGRIAHSGGFWVEPDWRKRDISGLLSDLGRGLALRNLGFDHITGVMLNDLAATGIGTKQYGYPHTEGQIEVSFYGDKPSRLVFVHMSKRETLDQMQAWLLFPEGNSLQALNKIRESRVDGADHQLVDVPAVPREG